MVRPVPLDLVEEFPKLQEKLTQLSMLTENHNRGESGSPGIMGWLHGNLVRLGRVTMGHSNFCPCHIKKNKS